MKNRIFSQKGQTLVELLVVVGAAAIIISIVTVAIVTSLNTSVQTKNQNLATQYAQEGLDIVRAARDRSASFGTDYAGQTYCITSTCTSLTDDTTGGPTCIYTNGECWIDATTKEFERKATLTNNSDKCGGTGFVEVSVKVNWTDGKCTGSNKLCHSSYLSTCLTE